MEEKQYSQLKEENHIGGDEEEEEYYFNNSEMAAAHQLMQLSDEDEQNYINKSTNSSNNIMMINKEDEADHDKVGEEVDQIYCRISTSTGPRRRRRRPNLMERINEEIFGKDDHDEVCDIDDRPRKIKKRRYRSLACIYRETKPIDDDDDRHCDQDDQILMRN
ncbi:hypothetical protein PanWU01x14_241750 [Parasponia andersonii]|uniref:Uncharacterized protein n=1 Tax=Parasponia andersonii TaxID=3476 RepID=A0A2P5BG72_PARAD|nr:hypothetical protein PanWU01x14_241750 [Parasponia andersonii]